VVLAWSVAVLRGLPTQKKYTPFKGRVRIFKEEGIVGFLPHNDSLPFSFVITSSLHNI
jgi:hypothetical protein